MAVPAGAAPTSYSYDELGRVTSVAYPDGSTDAYQYDQAGNRTQVVRHSTNVAPTAVNDSVSTGYNTPLTFNPRVNDSDGNGDPLTITAAGPASHGSVSHSDTSVTYSPNAGFAGSDSFTYSISDGLNGMATATVTVSVANVPPVANNDSIATGYHTPITFDPRGNDTDPSATSFSVTGVGTAAHGSTSYNGTSVTYSPALTFSGNDSFSYTITNAIGGSASATVSVSVANAPPVANDDNVLSGAFDPRENDTDPNNDTLSIIAVGTPAHGTVIYNANFITYTPTPEYHGPDSLSYTVSDGHGGTSSATIHVTVPNTPPLAFADSTSTPYMTPVTFDPRSNDVDYNRDPLTVSGVGTAGHGSTSYSDTSVTYTPVANFSGTDTFSYTISDGSGGSSTSTVSVVVGDGAPTGNNDSISTVANTPVTFDPRTNDTDPNGDALTVTGFSTYAVHGDVTSNGTSVTYTPYTHFSGTDSFVYILSDGHGGTGSATVNVSVANGVPVANPDTITTGYNTAVSFSPTINDSDPNGDWLTITSVSGASHGSLTFVNDIHSPASITYTPTPGYSGSDSFSYSISDGNGGTASATVNVTVQANPVNTIYVYGGNLRALADAQGYNGAGGAAFDFIVPEGTEIGSGLVTGSWPSNVTLHLIVNGTVYGEGGGGGNGSCAGGGTDGGNGGYGLWVQAPITVTVNGTLLGGGGGGAAANTYYDMGIYAECGGAGGGGGPNGNGGSPDGGAGSEGSGGSGGMGEDYYGATSGGSGGAPGSDGGYASGWGGSGTPGHAGQSIVTNGYPVTVNGSGTH